MKKKILTAAIFAGCILGSTALGQTLTITAVVNTLTDSKITLKCQMWIINRTSNTKVISGTLAPGNTITVQFNSPDAQRKECPTANATPTPTPTPADQTLEITGDVSTVTDQITLKCQEWTINRTENTKVISGTLSPGNIVTVQFNSPDAQRKECPTATATPTPTPTPTGG
jgi:hypothetical protein